MGVLYINNTKIDTSENINFPITYAIADIKNPNTRQRNRTKTIVLPDTPTNRRFFSSAYQISLSDLENTGVGFEFDHRLKYPARYVSNGVDIFNGVANLFSASITNGVLEIEVSLFSEIVNMFDSWGDLKVSELGWSEYDHTLSKANIEASWGNTGTSGYVYGLIYFGYNANQLTYKTNDLAPYVFQREIIKKALDFVGLGLSSVTLNDPSFKRRVWGFGGGEKVSITSAEVTDRYVFVDSDLVDTQVDLSPILVSDDGTNRTTIFNSSVQSDIQIGNINVFTINNNNLSQVDLSGGNWIGSWTVANTGYYKLSFEGEVNMTASWSYGSPSSHNASISCYWSFYIIKNGITIASKTFSTTDSNDNISDTQTLNLTTDTLLNASDVIEFGYKMESINSTIITNTVPLADLESSILDLEWFPTTVMDFKMESIDKELQDGDNVSIARWMPDVTVSEFFQDLIITENLYIGEPKDGVIQMESFDNYYTGTSENWTDKLDHSQKIIFEPPRLEGKNYKWRFAEDRDYFKADYFNEYGQDYGDYSLTIAGSYKQGDKVWQTKFAQTIPVDIAPNNSGELIVPVIAKSSNNGATFEPYKGKARVFYYNGMQTCYPWSFRDSLNATATTETEYPQFHHLNDIDTPTFDYNFNKPEKVYYTATNYTLKNIVQQKYFTFTRSVISKEAKIMKAYFNLNELDLHENFMQTYASIDCVRFIKNMVVDYNDNLEQPTMVELFKVVDSRTANTSQTAPSTGEPTYLVGQGYTDGVGVSYNTDVPQVIALESTTQLINNNSSEELVYMPNGVDSVYDESSDEFNFSELEVGSIIILTVFITASAMVQTELDAVLLIDDGGEDEKEIPFTLSEKQISTSQELTMTATILVDEVIKENTSKIMISNTTACTIKADSYQYIIKSINTWKR